MKKMVLLLLALSFLSNAQAQKAADKIVGVWFNQEKTSKIEIYKTSETYSGKIVWLAEMEKNKGLKPKDKNNPKPELRNREILGLDIITDLRYSDGKWIDGTIYTPKQGIYANCKAELLSDGRLKVFVSKSGFTKTQIWTRK
jgi:uncharacterized protein (DUF2147 family)